MGALRFLDLVIGMVFIYFLLSLVCVSFQELKANWRKERSKDLKKWIEDTFNVKKGYIKGQGLGDKLWKNILIDGLTADGRSASYIPKEVFVSALLDEIYYNANDLKNGDCATADTVKLPVEPYDFYSLLAAINDPEVCLPEPMQRVLRQAHAESHQNLETFRMRLERWYEMAMDRVTGTYKKNAQRVAFWCALAVTILLNVDSVQLANYLYTNPEEAKRLADQAEVYIEKNKSVPTIQDRDTKETIKTIQADLKAIKDLKLPLGWEKYEWYLFKKGFCSKLMETGFSTLLALLPGWILTWLAVSLGAPFWFDMLNKLVNLRAAGKIPNGGTSPSTPTTSKDNQPAVG